MSDKNRLQEKNELLVKLGVLFGPMQRLAEHPDEYNEQESAELIARYCAEWKKLATDFKVFSIGQPGHNYAVQHQRFYEALYFVFVDLVNEKRSLPQILERSYPKAISAISAIPIPNNSEILEAGSPFTAFCKLKDLIDGDTSHELIWVDAYMDVNLFHRFLRDVSPSVAVTLVTSEPKASASKKERGRWDAFLDVSRLFAQERGPSLYRLIVHPSPHDRWLLLDGKRLYHLGGSAKDAGNKQYFTISRLDASPPNLSQIQAHVAGGVEYFGPTATTHL